MEKIILTILVFSTLACGNANKTKNNIQSIKHDNNETKMKKTYFADFNFSGTFEVIFNGISLKRNNKSGTISGLEYLNPFIEKSGNQSITLIIKPLSGKISQTEINDYYLDIVYTDNGDASPIHKVMRCSFPSLETSVDSLIHTWSFEADVPFEINTLEEAQDLTNEDPQKLLEEVTQEYQKVHLLINEGKVNEYMILYKKSREREMKSMYYDQNKQKEYLLGIEKRLETSVNFMQPFVDFKLLLHPNGKIVSLINKDGKTPLYSIDDNDKVKTYGLQLYRSKTTGKLEVY